MSKTVNFASGAAIFSAIGKGSLKAKVERLARGSFLSKEGFEIVVDEDRYGENMVVQASMDLNELEELSVKAASSIHLDLASMSSQERLEWTIEFRSRLRSELKRSHDIDMVISGCRIYFERPAYKIETRWRDK
jgi:hypothetical protein